MGNLGDNLFNLVMSLASLWIAVRLFGCFLEKKEPTVLYGMACIFYFGYQLYFHTFIGKPVNMVLALLNIPLLFFIIATGFCSRGREKYYVLLAYYGIDALLEVCISSFVGVVFKTALQGGYAALDPTIHRLVLVIVQLFFFAVIYLLSAFWGKKDKRGQRFIPGKFILYLLCIPAGSICILFLQYYIRGLTLDSILVLSILILFNAVVFEMYVKMGEVYGEKMEQEVMRRQVTMYENEFELKRESDRKLHLLRHDLKNHMLLLSKYIEEGQYEEAKKYAGEICEETKTSGEYVKTGNGGVDSIVNYMLARAGKLGVRSKVTVQVPETPFMPDFDLNMLLGNLLENALEALEKAEEKTLDFYMSYKKQVLYISLCNTFDGKVRKKGDAYFTTKQDKGEHGFGITAIRHIVEKYHGEMRIEHTDKMFGTDIALYVSENEGKP